MCSSVAFAFLFCFFSHALALAGPPTHLPDEARGISGFNHACGTAVDSEGDIFVSSAGESKVRIFDSDQVEISFIANANKPCGLAVDSKGRLYVSEQATGNVVRYDPAAFPFVGAPSYGPPTTIDSSGEAEGIAIDPFDDRLFVARGNKISVYEPDGTVGVDEVQRVFPFGATGGTYKLSFEGEETGSLPYEATHLEVQEALEALLAIGAGDVVVSQGPNPTPRDHLVAFTGAMAGVNVDPIECNDAGLEGPSASCFTATQVQGFNGEIGAGNLTNATGVAAYTYKVNSGKADRYVFAADAATDEVKVFSGPDVRELELRRTVEGPKEGEDFGFGPQGAHLAVDPGNRAADDKCASVDEQACTAGHLLVYDDASETIVELEATGEFLDQITSPDLEDAEPTGLAIDRSGGPGDGTIYASVGPGLGAKLLAFGPLATPARAPLEGLSKVLVSTSSVATDRFGNVYVGAGPLIHVFGPDGTKLEVGPTGKGIELAKPAADLVVSSTCKVYALFTTGGSKPAEEKVEYHTPDSCPPKNGTKYSGPVVAADRDSFIGATPLVALGTNPANDHIFATNQTQAIELGSAEEGSPLLNPCFACGLGSGGQLIDIAAYGTNGSVYISRGFGTIDVFDPSGTEVLGRITGAGCSLGPFSGPAGAITVNQRNGHVLVFKNGRGAGEEYEASGACVTSFAFPEPKGFSTGITRPHAIAIDNSGGPTEGNAYIAFDDTKPNTFDLWAFGPLEYGGPPEAVTGIASAVGGGNATLNGTVNPSEFELESCDFEYLTEAAYQANISAEDPPFTGAQTVSCTETPAEIGKGGVPVAVHADISGLDPEGRYRFRLVAENKYGLDPGEAWLFGPPLIVTEAAQPVLYDEATLRAKVDPSGLATEYHFEYGTTEAYGQSTPTLTLPPGDGPVAVKAALSGLAEGTEYHFRVVAENEAKATESPDQTFETLQRTELRGDCPNSEYRTGLSAKLTDCRAYELVTPAETRGSTPGAIGSCSGCLEFNNWLIPPRGADGGERAAFFATTLPGFEGTGTRDAYVAERTTGEGAHPKEGWVTEQISPTFVEAGGAGSQHGIGPDQRHGFFDLGADSILPQGAYLATPAGLEPIGRGSLGEDLNADGRFIGPGARIVFTSEAHLEDAAPPEGTRAVYAREAGSALAEVISVEPDDGNSETPPVPFAADASYIGASDDGSSIAFRVGGSLYMHRGGQTIEVTSATHTFAGISEDGSRIFYAASVSGKAPAVLRACEPSLGPCTGAGGIEIAEDSVFVNVSPDGSRVLFTSKVVPGGALPNSEGETGEPNEHNLYMWDGGSPRFVTILDPADFTSFDGNPTINLAHWTRAVESVGTDVGRANSPTRATPGGEVFLFQSHAQLTSYDNEGHGQIYRYDPAAPAAEQLLCISCDPTGAPASDDALLQVVVFGGGTATTGVTTATTLIPNLTDDGQSVFFQSPEKLLPEDANEVLDVYEWKANGAGEGSEECQRAAGCLALISSGQDEGPSFLFGMSADGEDVFISTQEKLVGADVPGSSSIYDARREGGIPFPPPAAPCQGDACQGQGSTPPALPAPASTAAGDGGNVKAEKPKPKPCPKGKRRVKRGNKTRCVKRPAKKGKRSSKPRAGTDRRAQR